MTSANSLKITLNRRTDMKKDLLINIISILISLYVIILSIIGTSRTPVSEEVLKKKLDKKILISIAVSLSIAVLSVVIVGIFDFVEVVNSIILAVNMGFFVYMFTILFLLCMKNMDAMAKEIDEEKKRNTKNDNLLKEIKNTLITQNKKK